MRISAIIPAYNEGPRIENVLRPLIESNLVDEIIVVDDGSKDKTLEVALDCGVKVVRSLINRGKGSAVSLGLKESTGDLILLLDADLTGLNTRHISSLIEPVISDKADMTVGKFVGGRKITNLSQSFTPQLNGQRCLKRYILDSIENLDITAYGIEITINQYVKDKKLRVLEVPLFRLSQVTKEEKNGAIKGVISRTMMYYQIIKSKVAIKRTKIKEARA